MIYNDLFAVVFKRYFVLSPVLFRALLEGERGGLQDAHRRANQHQRERVIGTVFTSIIVVTC